MSSNKFREIRHGVILLEAETTSFPNRCSGKHAAMGVPSAVFGDWPSSTIFAGNSSLVLENFAEFEDLTHDLQNISPANRHVWCRGLVQGQNISIQTTKCFTKPNQIWSLDFPFPSDYALGPGQMNFKKGLEVGRIRPSSTWGSYTLIGHRLVSLISRTVELAVRRTASTS